MNIAHLWRLGRESKLREIALCVARQCEREIVELVGRRAATMNEHQARGYIKARAGLLVERRLREATGDRRRLSKSAYSRLEAIALDAVCFFVQAEIAAPALIPVAARRAA